MIRSVVLCAAALVGAPLLASARCQDKPAAPAVTLKAGDAAPTLVVEKWVKGAPVEKFESGKLYVVEFWAPWCAPCVASMPHLSKLQAQYKDKGLTIIGLSNTDSRGNTLEKVEKMVADKGDGMAYSVAWGKERLNTETFMKASGNSGIPCSFLVDGKGRLAYIGHPLFLDEPLARVLDGTWDAAKEAESYDKLQDEYWQKRGAVKKDPKGTLEYVLGFEKAHPKLAHLVTQVKFDAGIAAGDYVAAYAAGSVLADEAIAAKDAQALNRLAWTIVDPEAKLDKRDLELALRAAQAADELSESKDAAILDTLARTWFCKGDTKKAIELETKALELADAKLKPDLEKALAEFKAKAR